MGWYRVVCEYETIETCAEMVKAESPDEARRIAREKFEERNRKLVRLGANGKRFIRTLETEFRG